MRTGRASGLQAGHGRAARLLAWACALLLAAGTLPLYAIAFYNHPYYDDYSFSNAVHAVWQTTRDPLKLLSAALQSSAEVRQKWQGTYTGTFLSNLQPGVFSEGLYWLTTFILLTAFLLCFGFFLKTVFRDFLKASRAETVALVSLFLFVATQFMPSPQEAFYWFNGGVGNIFIYSLLALSLALLLRLHLRPRGAARRLMLLLLLVTLLGGGSYGGGLFGLLIFAAATAYAFRQKSRFRFAMAALTLWFLLCFLFSALARGNTLRSWLLGPRPSAPEAVLRSLYYGAALMGEFFTLPVLALLLLFAPALYRLAAQSPLRFKHPALALLLGAGVYCAQLTPPLYSAVFLGGGRIMDTYYVSFLAMALLYETYALGALARRREHRGIAAPGSLSPAANGRLALLCAGLLLLGCLGYKPESATLYGPMNMAGGSAALSIATGEAARYDREMQAREALLNDASQPVLTLSPLTATPALFMEDLLIPGAVYDVRPVLCSYYGKTEILLEGGASR